MKQDALSKLCIGTLTRTLGNQQNHFLVLLGAFQEAKRQLGEKLLETKVELDERKTNLGEKTLKKHGEKKTLETGKVWHSPTSYYEDSYKLCLAVYANGEGAGAGAHVS